MANFPDLGVLLEVAGAQLTTAYLASTPLPAGRFDLRAQVDIVAASGTRVTAIIAKLQSSRDRTRWCDVATTRDESGQLELEHSFAVTPGQSASHSVTAAARGLLNLRWVVRAVGGAGVAGDKVTVSGVAM
jgi:hypothetical protein